MKLTPAVIALAVLFAFSLHTRGEGSSEGNHSRVNYGDDAARHFTLNVLPVFKSKCFACHGADPDSLKGDLDMTSLESMVDAGAVVAGNPDDSLIVEAIEWSGLEMPPKENDRLNTDQINSIRKWIADGAAWPDEQQQESIRLAARSELVTGEGEIVATSGGLADDWTYRRYKPEDLWAIRPVAKPEQPAPAGYSVDAFVDRKLEQNGIVAAKRAEAATLIRRASYDLTGLPPTPESIVEFQKAFDANADEAWAELIESLLDSPHYGERWGQHWLDIVRYADTAGFSNDFELSNAWRYRDYVIRSFNNDLRYDRFVVQQIAGDELVAEQQSGTDGKNADGYHLRPAEGVVATGFLRMGPWEHTAMTPEKLSRQNYVDDVVNGLGQTFLSTALRCCKCHDHKFDPIPTRDYYRIYAALATTQPAEMPAEFLDEEMFGDEENNNHKHLIDEQRNHVQRLLTYTNERLNLLYTRREDAAKAWYEERDIADEYAPFEERRKKDGEKPERFLGLNEQEKGEMKAREQEKQIWTRRLERFEPLAQSVYNGGDYLTRSSKLRQPTKKWQLNKVIDNSVSHIFDGGSVYAPSEIVTPGVLSCVSIRTPTATDSDPFAITGEESRRRLQLARWIVDPKNGLATRSIVNRIWHYHFGKGLAANPNNFGATGAHPTHPDLLNWLTHEFVENGWSIKQLHRTIMLSETYMRSSEHVDFETLNNRDPENKLLAVFNPRRLTAEEIRDTMLAATDELNRDVGGLPVRPEINLEVAFSPRMIQGSLAPAYQPERTPEMRNRRTIYAYRIRGLRDPLMEVLDKPNPNESCELRDSASTTPQVFSMINGDVVTKRSIALALRLQQSTESTQAQIERGFQLVTGAKPDSVFLKELVDHYEKMVEYHEEHLPQPIEYPTRLTRSLVEEFSGETFEYEEMLDVYENYERDAEPADVGPETRALADICLLLFNSNQFMYVY